MEPSAPDPLDTLSLALQRGEDVLGDWYREAFPRVRRLTRGFLGSRDAADDVAQDVMLNLVNTIDRWEPSRPFAAWQRTVVLNRCRNEQRAAARRREHESMAGHEWRGGAVPSPEDAAAAGELSSLIDRALELLPTREREVFVLVDLEGVSANEAADTLRVAPSTVRAALSLARRRLRDAFTPRPAGGGAV